MLWVALAVGIAAMLAMSYVLGMRHGAAAAADELAAQLEKNRPFATAMLEQIAAKHGARVEMFDLGGGEAA